MLAYVGEAGLKFMEKAHASDIPCDGCRFADLDIHPTFDVAPVPSLAFQESLRMDLYELEPVLMILDPWYSYHGTTTKASDLHQEGALLNLVSAPCVAVDCSLQVVNHFNQTGTGTSLKRITQAGWASRRFLDAALHRGRQTWRTAYFT